MNRNGGVLNLEMMSEPEPDQCSRGEQLACGGEDELGLVVLRRERRWTVVQRGERQRHGGGRRNETTQWTSQFSCLHFSSATFIYFWLGFSEFNPPTAQWLYLTLSLTTLSLILSFIFSIILYSKKMLKFGWSHQSHTSKLLNPFPSSAASALRSFHFFPYILNLKIQNYVF